MTQREAIALIDTPALRGQPSAPDGQSSASAAHPQAAAHTSGSSSRNTTCEPDSTPKHWADLGSGSGTFTLALASFLPPGSTIEAIDLHPGIRQQITSNQVTIRPREADFTFALPHLPELDGILMANSLHYVRDKQALLQRLHAKLKPGGAFLLVEYDTDIPLPRWVPYPVSFATATQLFTPPHWLPPQRLHEHPSAFGRGNLYSAYTTSS